MNATAAALVVALIAAGHMAYMSRSSGQVSIAQKLSLSSASQFAVISQLSERLKDREVLLESAIAPGNQNLADCLRNGSCAGGVFRVFSSASSQFLSSQSSTDYRYNLKGGLCRQGGTGVGACEIAAVVAFGLTAGTLRIDVTVHTRQNTSEGAIGSQVLSTNPSLQPVSQTPAARDLLRGLATEFPLASFWANPERSNAPKCYPGDSRIPLGFSPSFGMICGGFTLSGATGATCPPGQVVKQVRERGQALCGPL
jgi:hypothetical protein